MKLAWHEYHQQKQYQARNLKKKIHFLESHIISPSEAEAEAESDRPTTLSFIYSNISEVIKSDIAMLLHYSYDSKR